VYRDFPLASIHSNAISAAEASGCAFEQDFYWEFHDRLFSMEQGLDRKAYIKYATDLGLDVDAFQECIDSRQYQAEVQADYDFAAQLGIRSTPTFFVNGLAVVGAQPFEVFQQVIERELAGEIP
jgi:protein-disulfide isomerase